MDHGKWMTPKALCSSNDKLEEWLASYMNSSTLDSPHSTLVSGGRVFKWWQKIVQVLEDLMTFREQSLRVILDLSSTVVTLLVSLWTCTTCPVRNTCSLSRYALHYRLSSKN